MTTPSFRECTARATGLRGGGGGGGGTRGCKQVARWIIMIVADFAARSPPGCASMRYSFEDEFAGLSSSEINRQVIGPEQRNLLRTWFGKGSAGTGAIDSAVVPVGLTVETLKAYHEIARRTIAAGRDVLETQTKRMAAIEDALEYQSS